MQVSLNMENLLFPDRSAEGHTVETPVKKNKTGFHSNLKTAETPNMGMSEGKPTLADVDAQELFDNFSRIVTVSESEEQFEQGELIRKLQYEQENKLDFDQSTNSMRKKRRGSRLFAGQEG